MKNKIGRRDEERQEGAPFVAVKAGRDEAVELRRDHWEREAKTRERTDAHIGEERLGQRGEDEVRRLSVARASHPRAVERGRGRSAWRGNSRR